MEEGTAPESPVGGRCARLSQLDCCGGVVMVGLGECELVSLSCRPQPAPAWMMAAMNGKAEAPSLIQRSKSGPFCMPSMRGSPNRIACGRKFERLLSQIQGNLFGGVQARVEALAVREPSGDSWTVGMIELIWKFINDVCSKQHSTAPQCLLLRNMMKIMQLLPQNTDGNSSRLINRETIFSTPETPVVLDYT